MNNIFSIISIILLFVIVYYAGQFLSKSDYAVDPLVYIDSPKCNPAMSSCRAVFDNGEIIVHFLQQPSALTPFDVEVLTRGFDAKKVSVTFVMNNMDMGVNAFNLDYQSKEVWRVKAILPVCSQARSDWIVEIRVKYKDKILRTDYAFE